jgi:lysyl-tRNA synthetase class 2
VDEKFVASLIHGLPACAGVALGVDRILMNILQAQTIDQVLTFAWPRC